MEINFFHPGFGFLIRELCVGCFLNSSTDTKKSHNKMRCQLIIVKNLKKKKRKKKEKKKKRLYPNLPQLKTRMWKFLWDFCYAPRHSRAFPWFQLYWYLAHQLDLRGNFTIPTLLLVTIIPLLMQTGLHVIIILSHILVTHSRYIEQSITLKFLVFFFYFTFSC